mgnify:CR=1 FL=1
MAQNVPSRWSRRTGTTVKKVVLKSKHADLRAAHPDSKLIIYGHTHNQVCDKSKSPWVVNPGAAGHTRNNDGGPCYMQILIDNDNWEIKSHCIK